MIYGIALTADITWYADLLAELSLQQTLSLTWHGLQ